MRWLRRRNPGGSSRRSGKVGRPLRHLNFEQFEDRRLLAAAPLVYGLAAQSLIAAPADATTLTVVSIAPADGSTAVPVNTAVAVEFSAPMDVSTVNSTTIGLVDALDNPIAATVTYDAGTDTAMLTPAAALANSTTFTLTVTGGVAGVADSDGDMLASDVTASFTTAAPLSVTAVTPADGSTNVSVGTTVGVQFDNPIDSATITTSTLLLRDSGGTLVAATVSYDAGNDTATLTPAAPLATSTAYTLTVVSGSGGVADSGGDELAADFTASFTTEPLAVASVTPANGSTAVAADTAISVQFNAPLDSGTVNTGTITLEDSESDSIPVTVVYDSGTDTATITPDAALANSMTYTLTVLGGAGGVNGADGSNLAGDFTSSFTTTAALAVAAVTPADGSSGVAIGTAVTVEFNTAMNAGTIDSSTLVLQDGEGNTVAATVTYDAPSDTATITPDASLANATTYTLTVVSGVDGVADADGNLLASDFTSSFTTGTTVTVVSVTPANDSTDVALGTAVTVTFSTAMDSTTLTGSTIRLLDSSGNAAAAAVTYDSPSETATITPTAPLAPGATYQVFVVGGATGVADVDGDTMAGDFAASFTTVAGMPAPAPGPGEVTIFSNATTPEYSNNPDTQSVELGVQFQSDESGYIVGIRFYKGASSSGTHVGNLWSSDGTLLATATFTDETASGWQEVDFSEPVAIQAGTTYIASYFAPNGNYADDLNFFASSTTNGPLTASGSVYLYDAESAFPTQTYLDSNYYVDVVFSQLIGAVSPASGATGTDPNSAVTVGFLAAMDADTISSATLQLDDSSGNPVAATVSYDAGSNTATLAPSSPLNAGETYTVTIAGGAAGVADSNGDTLDGDVTWTFTTQPSAPAVLTVTPADLALNVDVNAPVLIQFNESMNAATLTSSTLVLQDASNDAVAATIDYNSANDTATLTPNAAFDPSATYTVTVVGGAEGVADANGNLMAADFTSTFTTASPLSTGTFSLWTDSTTPTWVDNPDPRSVELGVQFQSTSGGDITGIRFYQSTENTGSHVVNLWASDGTLLATATSSSTTGPGWVEIDFAQPVYIQANATYVASYFTAVGNYSDDIGFFSNGSFSNSPLTAMAGVYSYGDTSAFPTSVYHGSNYWVDVVLEAPTEADATAAVVTPAAVVATSPAAAVVTSASGSTPVGYTPAQIRAAYGFNSITFSNGVSGTGAGQTIAIVDAYNDPDIAGDLATFDKQFGLTAAPSFKIVGQTGSTTSLPATNAGWAEEISLDVEWAHAIAPGANILLVEAKSDSLGDLLTAVKYAESQSGVSTISMSWGTSEFSGETAYDAIFSKPGITFVASSGDDGSPPAWPAISSNVLSVGGTSLKLTAAGEIVGETGWSGSTGGLSSFESEPSYQTGVQNTGRRSGPDVAYDADPNTGVAIFDSLAYDGVSGWFAIGGTSAGAPQWAALIAIADQGRAIDKLPALTNARAALYALPAADFHDITSGSNGGYSAGAAYDAVTGLGSPVANLIVQNLAKGTATGGAPESSNFGLSGSLGAGGRGVGTGFGNGGGRHHSGGFGGFGGWAIAANFGADGDGRFTTDSLAAAADSPATSVVDQSFSSAQANLPRSAALSLSTVSPERFGLDAPPNGADPAGDAGPSGQIARPSRLVESWNPAAASFRGDAAGAWAAVFDELDATNRRSGPTRPLAPAAVDAYFAANEHRSTTSTRRIDAAAAPRPGSIPSELTMAGAVAALALAAQTGAGLGKPDRERTAQRPPRLNRR